MVDLTIEWLITHNKQSLSFYCFLCVLIQPRGFFVDSICFYFRYQITILRVKQPINSSCVCARREAAEHRVFVLQTDSSLNWNQSTSKLETKEINRNQDEYIPLKNLQKELFFFCQIQNVAFFYVKSAISYLLL